MSALIKISLTTFLLCILASCDMFSSRAVTSPSTSSETDPCNLAQILTLSGKKFAKTDYEDMVHPNFSFIPISGLPIERSNFISRLNLISSKYDSVATRWTTSGISDINNGDTLLTVWRNYSVQFWKSGVENIDTGEAQIELIYFSEKSTWTIIQWKELGYISKWGNSFFNSNFSN